MDCQSLKKNFTETIENRLRSNHYELQNNAGNNYLLAGEDKPGIVAIVQPVGQN